MSDKIVADPNLQHCNWHVQENNKQNQRRGAGRLHFRPAISHHNHYIFRLNAYAY